MVSWEIRTADILDWAASYNGPKFHALLSDPPYELKFMGKRWDATGISFQSSTWAALAEHLHPGAFGMAFASSRGWHRLAVAIEDAGMIIQPSIFGWATGQSFPKATRIDTQIDKRAGKLGEREVVWYKRNGGPGGKSDHIGQISSERPSGWGMTTTPATPLARAWVGHRYGGQVLKNALEPIIVFQKPWEGKRLDCIVETGAGAMWVDGGRIATDWDTDPTRRGWQGHATSEGMIFGGISGIKNPSNQGRWPSNFTLTHHPACRRVGTRQVRSGIAVRHRSGGNNPQFMSGDKPKPPMPDMTYADPDGYETITAWDCVPECPVRRLGEMSGEREVSGTAKLGKQHKTGWAMFGNCRPGHASKDLPNDTGTAARFYFQADWSYEIAERLAVADPVMYCPKASRKERDAGLDGTRNGHPTVKPIALTRWLATLLLPPPEYAPRHLLIPFSGSGSEGIGAGLAGWEEMVLIDLLAENNEIAEARLGHWLGQARQLSLLAAG